MSRLTYVIEFVSKLIMFCFDEINKGRQQTVPVVKRLDPVFSVGKQFLNNLFRLGYGKVGLIFFSKFIQFFLILLRIFFRLTFCFSNSILYLLVSFPFSLRFVILVVFSYHRYGITITSQIGHEVLFGFISTNHYRGSFSFLVFNQSLKEFQWRFFAFAGFSESFCFFQGFKNFCAGLLVIALFRTNNTISIVVVSSNH